MDPKDFIFDFTIEPSEKAVGDSVAYDLGDGDLLIEGVGLNFEIDREDEAFEDSVFLQKSLDRFVSEGGPLCFHHKKDQVLGRVLSAQVIPGRGVSLKARVDHQPESSPLRVIYEQIKKGTIKHLSAGGSFKRRIASDGRPRIFDADFYEWSATATPVGRGTSFAVIGGKALSDVKMPVIPEVPGEIRSEDEDQIRWAIDELDRIFKRIAKRVTVID